MILIDVIPGQESGNAEFVQNGKAGFLAKNGNEFLEIFCHLFVNDQEYLLNTKENAKKIGRPSSALEIAKLIIDQVEAGNFSCSPKDDFVQKIEELLVKNHVKWKK